MDINVDELANTPTCWAKFPCYVLLYGLVWVAWIEEIWGILVEGTVRVGLPIGWNQWSLLEGERPSGGNLTKSFKKRARCAWKLLAGTSRLTAEIIQKLNKKIIRKLI